MSLVVQKYGGSSLANNDRVMNVARRVIDKYNKGNKVVVVVSAQGDTTDELIEKARQIDSKNSNREMDVLMSSGEQISMSLLAMAIQSLGVQAISLTGKQAGIFVSNDYSNARILDIKPERIYKELEKGKVVIVAGFQGINEYEDIATLGRGGSDTTAVALAVALDAVVCEIYTDVDGVYTADPRIVKNAHKLDIISYDEMLELASLGAKVLHNRSVELAKKYKVNMVVRSSFNNEPGTLIKEKSNMEGLIITGIAKDDKIAKITVHIAKKQPGRAYELFKILAEKNISVDIIVQAVHNENDIDIGFTVNKDDLEYALKIVNDNKEKLGAYLVESVEDVSKISIVGAGLINNVKIASDMFEALFEAGIQIHAISKSEIKISVLVDSEMADIAMNKLHGKFNL